MREEAALLTLFFRLQGKEYICRYRHITAAFNIKKDVVIN